MIKNIFKKINLFKSVPVYCFRGKANFGYCPIDEKKTFFIKYGSWLRGGYKCIRCGSIPRQRAIINTLNKFCSRWKDSIIHESSPGGVSSEYLKKKCKNYTASQFFSDMKRGEYRNGERSEDLEKLTFKDNSFDLFITQDVFEHVLNPEKAFSEIARVLKPGGAHIFTVPLYWELEKTRKRAIEKDGKIVMLEKEIYHGNPIEDNKSLVTVDWGLDMFDFIFKNSKMHTTVYLEYDKKMGLDAKFLEVFISRKI